MTVEGLIHGLRIYSVAVSSLVGILGTFQVKRWNTYLVENKLAWIALALLNFSVWFGSLQTLIQHAPGGERTYIVALATTFSFYAVGFHPARALLRHWNVRRIAKRAAVRRRTQSDFEDIGHD